MSEQTPVPDPASEEPQGSRLTRRQFLTLAGTTSAAAFLAACAPGATTAPSVPGGTPAVTTAPQVSTGGGELSYLHWTNFVPEMDAKLDELAKKWGDQNKVTVKVEHININDIPARRAAAIQAKAGPDLIFDTQNWPQLFSDVLVDISDVASQIDNYKLSDTMRADEQANPYVRPGDVISIAVADQVYVIGNVIRPTSIALTEPSGRLRLWLADTLTQGAQRLAPPPTPLQEAA